MTLAEKIIEASKAEARNYQIRLTDKVAGYFNDGIGSSIINSPTGSGKTVVGLAIARVLQLQHDIGIGWVAMRRTLLTQAAAMNRNLEIGCEGIKFISMFDKRPPKIDDKGRPLALLVIDEAQHDAANSMSNIYGHVKPKWILGLTATPYRTDRLRLCFDKVVRDIGIHQLIQKGYLSQYHQYTIPEWTVDQVVETYLREPERWGKSVIYWHKREHAIDCRAKLQQAGIKAATIFGNHPMAVREERLEKFEKGEIDVLINMMLLTEGWDCLDEHTEVLTEQGWKDHNQLSAFHQGKMDGDDQPAKVWSLNRETGLAELVDILDIGDRALRPDERMVEIKSQHLDILVTERHEFHIKYRDPTKGGQLSENWITRSAAQLVDRRSSFGLPLAADAGYKNIDLSDDELRLIAWSLTDSCWEDNYLVLYQSEKPTKHARRIRDLLNRLGVDYNERYRPPEQSGYETDYGTIAFSIPKGTSKAQPRNGWVRWAQYLDRDKRIVPALQAMSRKQLLVLYNEMILANGERSSENHSGWVWTCRKHQADMLNQMAILRGLTSNISTKITKNEMEVYRVTIRDRSWMTVDPSDERSASIEFVPYDGRVWCLRNKNSTIIIRRNGKTAIVGNSPGLRTVFVRDSQKGPTIQMAGRVFRKYPGIKYKQVVQSEGTRYPIQREATPAEAFVWMENSWRSYIRSPQIEHVSRKALISIAHTTTDIPDFITKKKVRQRRRGSITWER